jgi:hypothetical protein
VDVPAGFSQQKQCSGHDEFDVIWMCGLMAMAEGMSVSSKPVSGCDEASKASRCCYFSVWQKELAGSSRARPACSATKLCPLSNPR